MYAGFQGIVVLHGVYVCEPAHLCRERERKEEEVYQHYLSGNCDIIISEAIHHLLVLLHNRELLFFLQKMYYWVAFVAFLQLL